MNRFSITLLNSVVFFMGPLVHAERPFFDEPFLFGVHRGGSQWRPEHTVETYLEVVQRWPQALLEMDVRLTKDGAVVLLHDARVDRTTDGQGRVKDMTLAEVKQLDAGYDFTPDDGQSFPYRGKGLRIATLDEVLAALPDSRWLIELKTDGPLIAAVVKTIKAHDAEERVLIASFKSEVVEEIKQLMPKSPTCFTIKSGMNLLIALRAGGETWSSYQPADDVMSVSRGMIRQFELTSDMFQQLQAKGIKVQLHTPNTEAELRSAIDMGVDSILTDRPDILASLLEAIDRESDAKTE